MTIEEQIKQIMSMDDLTKEEKQKALKAIMNNPVVEKTYDEMTEEERHDLVVNRSRNQAREVRERQAKRDEERVRLAAIKYEEEAKKALDRYREDEIKNKIKILTAMDIPGKTTLNKKTGYQIDSIYNSQLANNPNALRWAAKEVGLEKWQADLEEIERLINEEVKPVEEKNEVVASANSVNPVIQERIDRFYGKAFEDLTEEDKVYLAELYGKPVSELTEKDFEQALWSNNTYDQVKQTRNNVAGVTYNNMILASLGLEGCTPDQRNYIASRYFGKTGEELTAEDFQTFVTNIAVGELNKDAPTVGKEVTVVGNEEIEKENNNKDDNDIDTPNANNEPEQYDEETKANILKAAVSQTAVRISSLKDALKSKIGKAAVPAAIAIGAVAATVLTGGAIIPLAAGAYAYSEFNKGKKL